MRRLGSGLAGYLRASRVPFALAAIASAFAILTDIATGATDSQPIGLSRAAVVAMYFATAAGAGAAILIARTWAVSRARAALVGFGAGVVFAVVFNRLVLSRLFDTGPLVGRQIVVFALIIGIVPGAFLGALYWDRPAARITDEK